MIGRRTKEMEEGRAKALRTAVGEVQGEGLLSAPVGGRGDRKMRMGQKQDVPPLFLPTVSQGSRRDMDGYSE